MSFVLEEVAFRHRDAWGNETGGGVHGISFEIKPGIVTCLTGPNGSGKSTIVKLCLGFAIPASGKISRPKAFRPGYIGDGGRNLYPHLSTVENLLYMHALRGWRMNPSLRAKACSYARTLSIDAEGMQIGRMSRGMRQKASIVCALLLPHDILFADEPTLGLDDQSVSTFGEMLEEERRKGAGVLLATNDLQLAAGSADLGIDVRQGTIFLGGGVCRCALSGLN